MDPNRYGNPAPFAQPHADTNAVPYRDPDAVSNNDDSAFSDANLDAIGDRNRDRNANGNRDSDLFPNAHAIPTPYVHFDQYPDTDTYRHSPARTDHSDAGSALPLAHLLWPQPGTACPSPAALYKGK